MLGLVCLQAAILVEFALQGGGRNAEPHIGVEVQICEGRSGIPPLGLFRKRENPMHTKTFILAGIALMGSG
jgi:hypothetical protein